MRRAPRQATPTHAPPRQLRLYLRRRARRPSDPAREGANRPIRFEIFSLRPEFFQTLPRMHLSSISRTSSQLASHERGIWRAFFEYLFATPAARSGTIFFQSAGRGACGVGVLGWPSSTDRLCRTPRKRAPTGRRPLDLTPSTSTLAQVWSTDVADGPEHPAALRAPPAQPSGSAGSTITMGTWCRRHVAGNHCAVDNCVAASDATPRRRGQGAWD